MFQELLNTLAVNIYQKVVQRGGETVKKLLDLCPGLSLLERKSLHAYIK